MQERDLFQEEIYETMSFVLSGFKSRKLLRADVGIHRESQISSEKSNFGLYHPNNPLEWLFQKMILRNPQAL